MSDHNSNGKVNVGFGFTLTSLILAAAADALRQISALMNEIAIAWALSEIARVCSRICEVKAGLVVVVDKVLRTATWQRLSQNIMNLH